MNKVYQSGRLVKEPEIITATSGIKIAKFTIAVKRKYKNEQGEYESDFFNCSAFRNSAEYIEKFIKKGYLVNVVGRLENRCFEANGEKKYYTEIVIDEIENCTSKPSDSSNNGELKPITDQECPF
jgi:single-strand DNA-binding protein